MAVLLAFRLTVIMSDWPSTLTGTYCLNFRDVLLELLKPAKYIPDPNADNPTECQENHG
jgi:hypothetical protein